MKEISCKACENNCTVTKYEFENGNVYYSGNKCEKVFSNKGSDEIAGENLSTFRYNLLFDRKVCDDKDAIRIGIPRALNMYENYPFWHRLLTDCGLKVVLSDQSNFGMYEGGSNTVMSDNICFPAKLVHGHIKNLQTKSVDRLFMPYVIFEHKEDCNTPNSFNCPIVSGYSDVIKSSMKLAVPLDSPSISFKDTALLRKACKAYIENVYTSQNVKKNNLANTFKDAFSAALNAKEEYCRTMANAANKIFKAAEKEDRIVIMLAGRPYHHDPLIQHKISDMVASFGVDVITDDIVRFEENEASTTSVMQWAYTNRILKAAKWVGKQGNKVHFVLLSSFGCGPDAFITDEVSSILKENGKNLTLLKIDDVSNIGSLRLRVRSLVESLRLGHLPDRVEKKEDKKIAIFEEKDRKKTIIMPHFSEYYSPMLPIIFKMNGYKAVVLPISDNESEELGLKYVNNEVCYPATLVVGDILKALKSGKYDLKDTAVIISQTGGQCRATNYLTTLRKAMIAAGYSDIPVLSLAMGDGMINTQPGFKMNWLKYSKVTINVLLYTDTISKLYYASVVREKKQGEAARLRDKYLKEVEKHLEARDSKAIKKLLKVAVEDFNSIINKNVITPKIGIVGEIFAKFNSFANKDVVNWLVEQNMEVVVPPLTDFFFQFFVNAKVNEKNNVEKSPAPKLVLSLFKKVIDKQINEFNKIGSKFDHFLPFTDVFDEAKHAEKVINLSAQFGEGWLIPAEFNFFSENGVNNAISLQPFGCIANHIVSKGIEKKITDMHPDMSILFLDFDNGVSNVNVLNRLHFMTRNAKEQVRLEIASNI